MKKAKGYSTNQRVKGSSWQYNESAGVINAVLNTIQNSVNDEPAILYLGHKQQDAIRTIEHGDQMAMDWQGVKFCGWPVVWVQQDSYCHLAR